MDNYADANHGSQNQGGRGIVLEGIVGAVLTLVCGGVWTAVIVFSGYEIGLLAWGIGALIGFILGGFSPDSPTAPIVAAVAAAISVAGAKLGVTILLGMPFTDLFAPFDLLWLFLAVSSAYKIAAKTDDEEA